MEINAARPHCATLSKREKEGKETQQSDGKVEKKENGVLIEFAGESS